MSDRPPATRGARIFGQLATIILLGGGALVVLLVVARVAYYLIKGF